MFQKMMGDEAENIGEMLDKDPKMINQMTGMWKQLDEMHSSDKKGYDEFINKQSAEWEEMEKKKKAEREK